MDSYERGRTACTTAISPKNVLEPGAHLSEFIIKISALELIAEKLLNILTSKHKHDGCSTVVKLCHIITNTSYMLTRQTRSTLMSFPSTFCAIQIYLLTPKVKLQFNHSMHDWVSHIQQRQKNDFSAKSANP